MGKLDVRTPRLPDPVENPSSARQCIAQALDSGEKAEPRAVFLEASDEAQANHAAPEMIACRVVHDPRHALVRFSSLGKISRSESVMSSLTLSAFCAFLYAVYVVLGEESVPLQLKRLYRPLAHSKVHEKTASNRKNLQDRPGGARIALEVAQPLPVVSCAREISSTRGGHGRLLAAHGAFAIAAESGKNPVCPHYRTRTYRLTEWKRPTKGTRPRAAARSKGELR